MSGSNELYIFKIKSSKPLNTDNKIINAAVPIATAIKETQEIICIKFLCLLVLKYRFAMKNEKFILIYFFKRISISSAYAAESSKKNSKIGTILS